MKNTKHETIDLTPTWEGLLPMLVELANSDSLESRKIAMSELRRLAQFADKMTAEMKEKEANNESK